MLDVFKKYAVNLDAEVDGVWRHLHGADFLIARSGNKNFNKALTEAYEKNREALEAGGDKADELAEQVMLGVMADTVILDWKNVGLKGKELPYSRENVIKLLSMPELRDFRIEIMNLAEDAEAYRLKEEAEQTKNS